MTNNKKIEILDREDKLSCTSHSTRSHSHNNYCSPQANFFAQDEEEFDDEDYDDDEDFDDEEDDDEEFDEEEEEFDDDEEYEEEEEE